MQKPVWANSLNFFPRSGVPRSFAFATEKSITYNITSKVAHGLLGFPAYFAFAQSETSRTAAPGKRHPGKVKLFCRSECFAWVFLRISADLLSLAMPLKTVQKSLPVRRQICYNFNNQFRGALLRIGTPIPFLPPSHRCRGITELELEKTQSCYTNLQNFS